MLDSQDPELMSQIVNKYPEEEKCALSIQQYIEAKFELLIPDEELMYLIIHLKRVISRN
ncbi:PRD domain-containing protein, partial [Paenibacillus polymyxa]